MRKLGSLLAAVLIAAGSTNAGATVLTFRSTVMDGQKTDLIQEIKLLGDIRLRHESFANRTAQAGRAPGRDRERLRLRYGAEFTLQDYITAGFAIATGAGEQVSTNQSFDNAGAQKGLWLDKAYVNYAPYLSDDGKVYASGGRMANPFWRLYSSDVVWDDDVNPEGFAQGVEWYVPSLGGIYFANAMQMVIDEDSGSRALQWMIGGQLGAEYRLPLKTRLRMAGAYYEWTNSRTSDFGQAAGGSVAQQGNRRLANRTLNDFKVAELTAQYSAWAGQTPVRLQGTVIRNTAAITEEVAGKGIQARNHVGYQTGAIVGEANLRRTWEAACFYKWLETDATPSDFTDSDFGNGGTNRRGHIFWLAYAPNDWSQIKAKFFYVRVLADGLPPGTGAAVNPGDDINRFQLDYSIKF